MLHIGPRHVREPANSPVNDSWISAGLERARANRAPLRLPVPHETCQLDPVRQASGRWKARIPEATAQRLPVTKSNATSEGIGRDHNAASRSEDAHDWLRRSGEARQGVEN